MIVSAISENFTAVRSESPENHRRYAVAIAFFIWISMAVSYALFLYKPSLFYFRAWEYLMEILHPNPGMPQVWEGTELGDMSRRYFFLYQEPHYTRVSIDADGFRSVPYVADRYQIAAYGDSQGFGSGLSDDQTFPWKLAEKVKRPIFNGTMLVTPEHLLGMNALHDVRILIHVLQSYAVSIRSYFPDDFAVKEYVPLRKNVWPVATKRFNPFAILTRAIKGIWRDVYTGSRGINDYMCQKDYRIPYSDGSQNKSVEVADPGIENDMIKQIAMIDKFNRRLKALGYVYVLVLVPRRELLYSDQTDEFSTNYFPRLIKSLEARGVHAVDLQDDFLANRHLGLYFHTDSHWNARGTEIAAARVAEYLQKKGIIRSPDIVSEYRSINIHSPQSSRHGQ